ncbi:hypothetical protein [Sulfitobacter aestuariivivens]|uniref:hypothetical protein n=1 Tax=Sulfitobacter aestuariivivens TaxID=2766981 RepID=UPI0036158B9D
MPDKALLVRIDRFEVEAHKDGSFEVGVDVFLSMINDRDQWVTDTRRFAQRATIASNRTREIVTAFQAIMDVLLPEMSNWAVQQM